MSRFHVMEVIFSILLLVVSVASFLVWTSREAKRRSVRTDGVWAEAAQKLGFRLEANRDMRGVINGRRVVIDTHSQPPELAYPRLRVEGLDGKLDVFRQDPLSKLGKALGGQDVETGDGLFDESFVVRGDELLARSIFGSSARKAVRDARLRSYTIGDGVLQHLSVKDFTAPVQIVDLAHSVVSLAEHHDVPKNLQIERVVEHALNDPLMTMRERNLKYLVDSYPGTQDSTLRKALEDRDWQIRWYAATKLHDLPTIQNIATTHDVPAGIRLEAVRLAGRISSDGDALASALVPWLSEEPESANRVAIIEALDGNVSETFRLALVNQMGPPYTERETVACARALSRIEHPDREDLLIGLLESPFDSGCAGAAECLAEVGSRKAVETLLPLTKGLATSGEVKRAARQAVAAIQARLAGAEAGRLTVADVHRGAGLSFSAEPGALSEGQDARSEAREEAWADLEIAEESD